jgi:hypothetical protein
MREENLNNTSEDSGSKKQVKSSRLSNNSICHSNFNSISGKLRRNSDVISDVMSEENMRKGLDKNVRSSQAINS